MLVVRPYPLENEAFEGYVFRLAKANFLKVNQLLNFYSFTMQDLYSRDQQTRINIKQRVGQAVNLNNIESLFDIRSVSNNYRALFNYRGVKFCPDCCKEKAYLRWHWNFKNYTSCHVHNTILLNRCPACDTAFDLLSFTSQCCNHCGADSFQSSDSDIDDPISKIIAKELFESDLSIEQRLTLIKKQLEQLEPYIRLLLEGDYKKSNDLQKMDLSAFADIQIKAHKLRFDESESVNMLTSQLNSKVDNPNATGLSFITNKYRSILKQSSNPFIGVFRQALKNQSDNSNDYLLSLELISMLWKLDEQTLTKAFDSVDPMIRNGKKKVKLTDFSLHADEVLSIAEKLSM